MGKFSPAKALTSSNNALEVVEQPVATKKEVNADKGVTPNAMKLPTAPQDLPAEKEVPKRMEIIMAALPLPVKGDLASKDSEASKAASTQPIKAPPKEKIVIKKK